MTTYLKIKSRFEGNCLSCKKEIVKGDGVYVMRHKRRLRLCLTCGNELHDRVSNGESTSIVMLSNYKDI